MCLHGRTKETVSNAEYVTRTYCVLVPLLSVFALLLYCFFVASFFLICVSMIVERGDVSQF